MPPAVEVQSLNHWTTWKVPKILKFLSFPNSSPIVLIRIKNTTGTWEGHDKDDITAFNYLPVAQLFGKIYVEYMRQNVDQLSRVAQCSSDRVSRVIMLHVYKVENSHTQKTSISTKTLMNLDFWFNTLLTAKLYSLLIKGPWPDINIIYNFWWVEYNLSKWA